MASRQQAGKDVRPEHPVVGHVGEVLHATGRVVAGHRESGYRVSGIGAERGEARVVSG